MCDELAGPLRVVRPGPSLTRPVLKHLPGQHDQKTHGRGGNHGLDAAEQVARAKETGESMHLPFPYPSELQGPWDAAEDANPYRPGPETNVLKIRAMSYAINHGLSVDLDEDDVIGDAAAEIYSNAILRRRFDATVQQKAWDGKGEGESETLAKHVREVRATGTVAIAVPSDVVHDILDDGRFLSQFEANDSGGALDPDMRAMMETALFDHHPHVNPEHRPIYGYVAPNGDVTTGGVRQYGDARFVLKPETVHRATMTVGDTLNTHATPIPMVGDVSERDIFNASARTIIGDEGQKLVRSGPSRFADWHYFEAQIHGGVTLDDVVEVHLPHPKKSPYWTGDEGYITERFAEHGIPVVWDEG